MYVVNLFGFTDLGRIKTLVNIFVDNNPLLNWLPLSLKSKKGKINIGLNRFVRLFRYV